MEPPFLVGGEHVEPPYFIDREEELQRLVHTLGTLSENVVLLSIRRMGKSSLLHNALNAIRKTYRGVLTAHLNCRDVGSAHAFADRIIETVLEAYRDQHAVRGWARLRAHLEARRVKNAMEEVAAFELTILKAAAKARIEFHERTRPEGEWVKAAFEFLQGFTNTKRRLVLVLDEFQELDKLPASGRVFQLFKSYGDRMPHVRFAFSGSGLSLLDKVFLRPDSPLYLMAGRIALGPLGVDPVTRFVSDRLRRAGVRPTPAACRRVHDLTGGVPYYVQKLGLMVWLETMLNRNATVDAPHVDAAFRRLLGDLSAEFEARLEHKYGPLQKEILQALATGDLRRRDLAHRLHRPEGQLSEALNRLAAVQEIVKPDRGFYHLTDPVFGAWVRQRKPMRASERQGPPPVTDRTPSPRRR